MKYRIVYPNGFTNSACYLVGHDQNGKPIYRYHSTNPPKQYSAHERAMQRVMLASVLGALTK